MPTGAGDFDIYRPVSISAPSAPPAPASITNLPFKIPSGWNVHSFYIPLVSQRDVQRDFSATVKLSLGYYETGWSFPFLQVTDAAFNSTLNHYTYITDIYPAKIGALFLYSESGGFRKYIKLEVKSASTQKKTFAVRHYSNTNLLEQMQSNGTYTTVATGVRGLPQITTVSSIFMSVNLQTFKYDSIMFQDINYTPVTLDGYTEAIDIDFRYRFTFTLEDLPAANVANFYGYCIVYQ